MSGAFGRLGGITGAAGALCLVASAAPFEPGGWFAEVAGAGVGLMLLGLVAIYIHARPVLPAWAGLGLVLAFAGIAGFLAAFMLAVGADLYVWLGIGLMLLGPVAIYIHPRPALPAWAGLGLVLAFAAIVGLLAAFMIFWAGDGDLWLLPAGLTMVGISVFLAGLHRGGVLPLSALGMLASAQVVGIFAYEASGQAHDLLAWTALALAAAGCAWTAVILWNAPRSPGSTATRRPALR